MGKSRNLLDRFLTSIKKKGFRKTAKRSITHPETIGFALYSLITGFGTIVGTLMYYALIPIMHANFAYLISQYFSVFLIFILNWIEGSSRKEKARLLPSLLKFTGIQSVTLAIGSVVIYIIVHVAGIDERIAIWIVYPVTFVLNFALSRLFVFNKKQGRKKKRSSNQGGGNDEGGE
ncbi:MAG: GtrA family protein [Oscillospiraceae bacterium]|jgi:putative flippase GtrA|nr:GtrA family protein [Oscillospiraceae bacterium]